MATAGKILMYPVGNWTSGNNYGFLDIVYYGGSSYIAKTDITNSTINPVTDTTNWQILAHGYMADTLSGIDGIDTSGLLGTAGATVVSQTLMDKIADMVADKLVLKTAISNQQINDTGKVTGSALTYAMNQTLTEINSNLAKYNMEYHARIYLTSGYISGMVNDKISQGYKGGDIALSSYAPPDNYNGNQYGIIQWTLVSSDIAHLRFLVPRSTAIITRAISVSESYDTGWTVH